MQNRTLTIALVVSAVVHGVLLLIHLVAPAPPPHMVADPGLEVVLVNARHDRQPLKAEALAQANLDGGGNATDGMAKSPLPDMRENRDGETIIEKHRKIQELEDLQTQLLTQARLKTTFRTSMREDKSKRDKSDLDPGEDADDSKLALARSMAVIEQRIEDQNKRPRKTLISPSTREVGYALYYKSMKQRIEKIGTLNFPNKNGEKLYGELIVSIPIFQDGSIYEKDGGPTIEKSSGNSALDSAALRIVRRSAPFGAFPKNMRSTDRADCWVAVTSFKFTREQVLETELKGD